jgi:hypothetical protein
MRPSELKTPLARMRKQINTPKVQLMQETIAGWIGVCPSHYRKIECDIKPLKPKHAFTISRRTRIHPDSLLSKDKNKPLLNVSGVKWTPRDFQIARKLPALLSPMLKQYDFAALIAKIAATLLASPRYDEAVQRLHAFTAKEFLKANGSPNDVTGLFAARAECSMVSPNRLDLKPILAAFQSKL